MAWFGDPFEPGNLTWVGLIGGAMALGHPGLMKLWSRQPRLHSLAGLMMTALVARLLIFPMAPGDDFWRYWWEGMIQAQGFNPYLLAPNDAVLADWRTDWWSKINHRDWATIYPPLTELMFRGLAWSGPATILAFKTSYLLADLLIIWLLAKWSPEAGGGIRSAMGYALHPLPLFAFCGSAHFDVWMVAALMLGLFLVTQGEGRRWRWAGAATAIGLAAAVKVIPLLCGFIWLRAFGKRVFWLALVPLLLVGPAFLFGFPEVNPWANLNSFAIHARFNDFFWWLLDPLLKWELGGTNELFLKLTISVVGVIGLAIRRDWQSGIFLSLGAVLLLAPVLYPWYVAWILPLAFLQRSLFWQASAGTIMLSLSLFDPMREGWLPLYLDRWVIVGVPCLLLLWSWAKKGRTN